LALYPGTYEHHFCRQRTGFETCGAASVRKVRVMGNVKMGAGKTVNFCFLSILIFPERRFAAHVGFKDNNIIEEQLFSKEKKPKEV
jgi:hypothetical protein